jgi:hypothetical protein
MPEGPRSPTLSDDDVFAGEGTPNDLISGPTQIPGRLVWADTLLEAA